MEGEKMDPIMAQVHLSPRRDSKGLIKSDLFDWRTPRTAVKNQVGMGAQQLAKNPMGRWS